MSYNCGAVGGGAGGGGEAYNDRPISVNSVLPKVFERIAYNQLSIYLSVHNILSKHQSGFRSFSSTVTALLETTDSWAHNIDHGNVNGKEFLNFLFTVTHPLRLLL